MNKLAIALVISIPVCLSVFFLFTPFQVIEKNAYLTVTEETVGINVDTDAVRFGSIFPGGSGSRPINISTSKSTKVVIKATGELADWIIVSNNTFFLKAGETTEIQLKASVPEDAEIRDYQGTVLVYFYRDFTHWN